ncbi:RnfH family protein [Pseudomonas floridensis]|uniref:UPF0125 protein BZK31_25455 n=1 Tax=Pseudomonas floridensis TaxID=1958950 RepID=A0A1X0MZ78_9PSED|nr:RnfH family protein [Pseudomonas floridensis]ORC54730.1 RnfH family protein [Pseudomonas floridensis]
MSDALIAVEVVYATAERQVLMTVNVPVGATVRQVLAASGMNQVFPELDLAGCAVGIFGEVVNDPEVRRVEAGERIEIYRPLLADPMEVRRQRAAKARQNRASSAE